MAEVRLADNLSLSALISTDFTELTETFAIPVHLLPSELPQCPSRKRLIQQMWDNLLGWHGLVLQSQQARERMFIHGLI